MGVGVEAHVHAFRLVPELDERRVEIEVGAHRDRFEYVGVGEHPRDAQQEVGVAGGGAQPAARHANRLAVGRDQRPASLEAQPRHHVADVGERRASGLGVSDRLDEADVAAEPAKPEEVLQHGPRRPTLPWRRCDHAADDDAGSAHHSVLAGPMAETIVVAGSLAQRPHHGGHTWVFLQWLLGFRRLGWEVHFVDRLDAGMCVDAAGDPAPFRDSSTSPTSSESWRRSGSRPTGRCCSTPARDVAGRPHEEAVELARRSALLLNVMGFLDDETILGAAPLRVFLDIDPGFGHMWQELGLAAPFAGHDRYVTVGGNVGRSGCAIPDCGLDWVTTLPPVQLSEWPPATTDGMSFTSVASWRGPFGPIEYGGRTYGLRVHEFRRFLELPERAGVDFELALDIDEADEADLRKLREHGWQLADPLDAAGDPWRYREYVQRSAAELMIAKNLYVDTRSGWFSDRSACYLASGRPVLAQDTGLEGLVPTGDGVLTFRTPEEAAAGARAIVGDYRRHSRAARELAAEHFAAERVLPALLSELRIA